MRKIVHMIRHECSKRMLSKNTKENNSKSKSKSTYYSIMMTFHRQQIQIEF